jgi:hypothetical protein
VSAEYVGHDPTRIKHIAIFQHIDIELQLLIANSFGFMDRSIYGLIIAAAAKDVKFEGATWRSVSGAGWCRSFKKSGFLVYILVIRPLAG